MCYRDLMYSFWICCLACLSLSLRRCQDLYSMVLNSTVRRHAKPLLRMRCMPPTSPTRRCSFETITVMLLNPSGRFGTVHTQLISTCINRAFCRTNTCLACLTMCGSGNAIIGNSCRGQCMSMLEDIYAPLPSDMVTRSTSPRH